MNIFEELAIDGEQHSLKEFVLLPANVLVMVRNSVLNEREAIILSMIDSFSRNGVCFASNNYFAKFFGCNKRSIERTMTKLMNLNLITTNVSRGNHMRTISIVTKNYHPKETRSIKNKGSKKKRESCVLPTFLSVVIP